jgi:dipeptidyl aminopeptidase/acylaminoacyl peptidase
MSHLFSARFILAARVTLVGLAIAFTVSPLAGRATQAPRRAFETKDWYKVKTLGSPAMSPDGKFVAVQVTSVIEAKNMRMNEIWVVATAPGADAFRVSAPGLDSTSPSFSADSTTVIYSSTRPGYANTRWASRVDRPSGEFAYTGTAAQSAPVDAPAADFGGRQGGGGNAAASQPNDRSFTVTTGVEGAATPGGPGGGRAGGGAGPRGGGGGGTVAPTSAVAPAPADAPAQPAGARGRGADPNDPYGKMPAMAKPPANAITVPLDPARFDGMQITDERYKANGRGFVPSTGAGGNRAGGAGRGGRGGTNADATPAPTQILIDHLDGAGRKALTSTPYSHRNAVVSPDGKWIVFAADAELRADAQVSAVRADIAKLGTDAERTAATRDKLQTDLFVIPVAGGGTPKRIKTAGLESGVEWSADSKYFTFTANNGPNTAGNIYLGDAAAGTSKSLTSDLRTDLGPVTWLASGDALLQLTVGGRNALYRVNPRTGDRKEIVGGRRRVAGYSYDKERTKVAFVATAIDLPTELFVTDLNGATPERQLTHFNDDINNTVAWSPGERFTYKSVRDVEVEAWLMKPYGYEPGKKYPLVLYIHGGPHSAYNEGWFDEFQNLTGAGMFVLYTNPRGSSGYGAEFQDMIRNRWGDEDYMDLMKAVDLCVARPDVDAARLGVTGGSYGGFMTTWITTKTDRFKAAEADRMIVNWVSWYGTSDAQSLTEGEFLGNPWENWDSYINMSPIKYANKVKTPTLLVQSEEDYRAPIEDAEQWFMALKKNGVPAEFVRYPRSNHDLSRTGEPWLLTDRLYRIRTWFSYWLKDEKAR